LDCEKRPIPEVRPEACDIPPEDDSFIKFLPLYLQNDIKALIDGRIHNSTLLDCLYCEVQGSINSAFYNNEITEQEAKLLRARYLGLE